MRKLFTMLAAFSLVGWIAAPASAAMLPVNGTLGVAIGTLGGPSLTGSGVGDSSGSSSVSLPASVLKQTSTANVPITPPALGLGLITVPASAGAPVVNLAGTIGAAGTGAISNNGVANLFFTNGAPAGSVPLKYIGGGGSGMALVAGIPVTLVGAVWTKLGIVGTGLQTTMIMQVAAGIPVTITATAFDNRTAGGAGTVQFVAPAAAKLFGGNLGTLPVVGVLTLQFIPEPGTLLLVGSGLVGLVALGRRKHSSN